MAENKKIHKSAVAPTKKAMYLNSNKSGGLYDPNGGGRKAANADMEWYSAAGQLDGTPETLKIEDFWYLAPLDAAMK